MKFKNKFKKGDIIRRGGVISPGRLMVVEERGETAFSSGSHISLEENYRCIDLFISEQYWRATEIGEFTLATDEDIIAEISRLLTIEETVESEFGDFEVHIEEDKLFLTQDEGGLFIDPIAALKLKDIIDQYVEEL